MAPGRGPRGNPGGKFDPRKRRPGTPQFKLFQGGKGARTPAGNRPGMPRAPIRMTSAQRPTGRGLRIVRGARPTIAQVKAAAMRAYRESSAYKRPGTVSTARKYRLAGRWVAGSIKRAGFAAPRPQTLTIGGRQFVADLSTLRSAEEAVRRRQFAGRLRRTGSAWTKLLIGGTAAFFLGTLALVGIRAYRDRHAVPQPTPLPPKKAPAPAKPAPKGPEAERIARDVERAKAQQAAEKAEAERTAAEKRGAEEKAAAEKAAAETAAAGKKAQPMKESVGLKTAADVKKLAAKLKGLLGNLSPEQRKLLEDAFKNRRSLGETRQNEAGYKAWFPKTGDPVVDALLNNSARSTKAGDAINALLGEFMEKALAYNDPEKAWDEMQDTIMRQINEALADPTKMANGGFGLSQVGAGRGYGWAQGVGVGVAGYPLRPPGVPAVSLPEKLPDGTNLNTATGPLSRVAGIWSWLEYTNNPAYQSYRNLATADPATLSPADAARAEAIRNFEYFSYRWFTTTDGTADFERNNGEAWRLAQVASGLEVMPELRGALRDYVTGTLLPSISSEQLLQNAQMTAVGMFTRDVNVVAGQPAK